MIIIKHLVTSEKVPDQTTMKVIRDLHLKEGFRDIDGWTLKTWERKVTMTVAQGEALHRILYIIHRETGHVVTSHVKAWNDAVRMTVLLLNH